MKIRIMIGDRETLGLRLWERSPPPANGEPAKTGAGLVTAERRGTDDVGGKIGFSHNPAPRIQ